MGVVYHKILKRRPLPPPPPAALPRNKPVAWAYRAKGSGKLVLVEEYHNNLPHVFPLYL